MRLVQQNGKYYQVYRVRIQKMKDEDTVGLFPQRERMQSFSCDKLLLRREEVILLLEDTTHQYCSRFTNTIIPSIHVRQVTTHKIEWHYGFVCLFERDVVKKCKREREDERVMSTFPVKHNSSPLSSTLSFLNTLLIHLPYHRLPIVQECASFFS